MAITKTIIILSIIIGIIRTAAPCNATSPYTFLANGTCFIHTECPWVPPTQYYGDPVSNTCVTGCSSPSFGFDGNKTCVTTCPLSPNMTYYDYVNRRCTSQCPENYFGAANQSCLTSCPTSTYGNSILWICVSTCPVGTYYATINIRLCVTICPTNYYASPIDRTCYIGGSCPTSPVLYYADDTTNLCVMICPSGYFADIFTGRCLIYCSLNYFADLAIGKCVQTCPSGYYRSSLTRTCVKTCTIGYFSDTGSMNCTQICPSGSYGDSLTGTCNPICTAPNFADPTVSLCVSICSSGLFADNYTQSCVTAANCYSNTIGDPTTYKCIYAINCPKSPYMFADLTNKICRTKCTSITWGDLTTQTCVSNCPWDTSTYVSYKNSLTQQCVTKCPSYPILYADNSTKSCVPTCPQTPQVPFNTYGDSTTQSCVTSCPIGYRSDSSTLMCLSFCPLIPTQSFFNPLNGTCVTSCPTGFYADLYRQLCTITCSIDPKYFAYNVNNTCLFTCPTGFYADNSTNNCVATCPQTTLQYSDNSTNYCVTICPSFPSYFGQINLNGERVCVSTCSVGTFADPVTRTCVSICNSTLGYYGQLLTPLRTCLIKCPSSKYADNTTSLCVSQCPTFPKLYYGNPTDQTCVLKCPAFLYGNSASNLCVQPTNCQSGFFADIYTRLCVKICPLAVNTFGQSTSRKCLQICPNGTYADSTTRLCSSSCNSTIGIYKDPSTKTCVIKCPSKPNLYADPLTMTCTQTCTSNYFALDSTRTCVQICPSTPLYYGNYATYRCVLSCPIQTYSFTNNTFRGCVNICPPRVYSVSYVVDLFADNSTWSCVTICPLAQNYYSFSNPNNASIRLCVSTCPMVGSIFYFSQNTTQSCVTTCPSATLLTYGDIFSSKCVFNCSRNQYRDTTTSRCVYLCSPGFFADNTTWNCVSKCPIGLFAETINRTCSKNCPFSYYADNITGFCRSLCNTSLFLYSDNTTWKCVSVCTTSPDYYADPNTKLCSISCTGGLFADNFTRSCLQAINCSNNTLGQPVSGRCATICPIQIPSFLDTSQNLCTTTCPTGLYADNSTMICVSNCPSNPDYYAYNSSLLSGICVLFCPILPTPYYRYSITRQCVLNCPGPSYFKDTNNLQCVTSCPPYYYAQTIGQICILNCNINNKYGYQGVCLTICPNTTFADNTTFLCVNTCPFGYFAQNASCVPNCANGTFADPFTKLCSTACSPDYYAYSPTNYCLQNCQPYFKYFPNQTCTSSCPATTNISTNLYMDTITYSCLNACLPTWYADNITRSCTQTCTSPLSADNSTGLCVARCPTSPDYYSYNLICYFPCPAHTPALFAQNDTRTCMTICPNGSFADSFHWRCVAKCSGVQYGFSDGTINICVNICSNTTYGDNKTKTCVSVCPNNTFGQNNTRLCLKSCPTGSYAESHINLCVIICNSVIPEYSDPSTHSCVTLCPSIPSLYGQLRSGIPVCVPSCQTAGYYTLNTTRLCVNYCVSPFFADSISGTCAYKCPINYNFYADNSTRICQPSCPNVTINSTDFFTYADDSTKTCVFACPFSPSLYGDNSTNKCVKRCPAFTYGDNDTRLCLQTCFFGILFNNQLKYTFADNMTNFCVPVCPANSWADNFTYTCVTQCTPGTFADDSTWKCVKMCPANPISYAYIVTQKCVYSCPGSYLASQVGRQCLYKSCPTDPDIYFQDTINNQCVLKCVFPYFGEIKSQTCALTCSYGYFQDLGAMTCTLCPSSCLTCLNSQNCTSCQSNLYLFEGQCLTNCPTFPIYYYKYNPSFSCIQVCPPPYFGFNTTGSCQNTCPPTFFSNVTSNTCQACPTGCSTCDGASCSNCINGYVYVPKYLKCSLKCSLGNQYFLNAGCVSSCPSGTFLLDDLVTCQSCSPICAQCFNVANNCTKCQGAFWYNYNCVDQCPTNSYVDSNNFCQKCSNNPSACLLAPLSYTLTVKTVNYQIQGIVTFNRPVNLTTSQFSKIAMLQTQNRPVKASQYTVTQTSPTTYTINFIDSNSLNQISLSLSFTPGSITDLSGNGLTSMSSGTSVTNVQTISPQTLTQAKSLSNKVNIVSYILVVVLLLMMIKCSYPMIVLIDLLQFIYMHIYVLAVPLPYLFMQVLSSLKNINFTFLPQLYTMSNANSNGPYNSFQTDTTFLGNCQPFVIFLAAFGGTYLIFWLLSIKKINCWTWLRRKVKYIFNGRMRFSFLHEIFYYTGYYVIFFGLYQFTGINASMDKANMNLAAAIIVIVCYTVWLIIITYIAVKYSKKLDNIPNKFKFLVYQDSQFPMQIPMRCLNKFIVGCILITPTAAMQLIFLMILNLVYIIYTLCYSPSKNKATNIINTIIHLLMITYEIVLFAYSISEMSTSYQSTISQTILAILGVLIALVGIWMFYRFIMLIRTQCFGYKQPKEEQMKVQADSGIKMDYQKIHSSNKILSQIKDKQIMNYSQLNFKDQQQQCSDAQSINVEEAMQQFTYHFVPKKTEGMIKQQNQLIGIKESKKGKRTGPIVIQINQDELLEHREAHTAQSRGELTSQMRRRVKSGVKKTRDHHLRIEDDSHHNIEQLHIQQRQILQHHPQPVQEHISEQSVSSENYLQKRRKRRQQSARLQQKKQPENLVVWDNFGEELRSREEEFDQRQ